MLEFGERWIEGTFFRRARAMGNDIGYDSIVGGGSHATTLHWIDNTGPITPGELVLLDMGVEGHNLYTADVTRTLPVDGTFTPLQRDLYDLVYAAQQAGIDAVRPGAAVHSPPTTRRWTCSPTASRTSSCCRSRPRRRSTRSRRSTPAGRCTASATCSAWTCTTAARPSPEAYPKGDLAEGMVLTVEPGLYFQEDDLLVPEELRGIGIRIEDDILVTADGSRNLSGLAPPHVGRRRGVDGASAEDRLVAPMRPRVASPGAASVSSVSGARPVRGPDDSEGLEVEDVVVHLEGVDRAGEGEVATLAELGRSRSSAGWRRRRRDRSSSGRRCTQWLACSPRRYRSAQ